MLHLLPAPVVTTAICGILLPFLGLAMVVDFALGSPGEALDEEADSLKDGISRTRRATHKNRTISRIIIRISVMAATLPILLWTVYMGYRLVKGPRDGKHDEIALIAGIITMAFGITLLLNGITIAKELSQELTALLQLAEYEVDTHTRQHLTGIKA